MEMSTWLSEMGLEDPNFTHQYQMCNLDDAFGEDYQQYYSSESFPPFPDFNPSPVGLDATQSCLERPIKQIKSTGGWSSCTLEQVSSPEGSSPNILSFGNSSSPTSRRQPVEKVESPANKSLVSDSRISQGDYINQNYAPKAGQSNKRAVAPPSSKTSSYTQDHIIAERKRREKLSQGFIALSAIVPGLKKMDKTSVLETSIRYIKELQERAKTLEDQTAKKSMESVVFVKKYQIPSDDDSSSSDVTSTTNSSNEQLPEIETRVSGKNVLIRIHCEKQKGVLAKTLDEIEKLNLSVVSSSIIPFGTATLDITVVAQMGEEFDMAVKDLVKKLRLSFRQFM